MYGYLDGFFGGFILLFFFVIIALFLIPFIFYLITLQNTLKAIAPQNRMMEPSNVWLMFIPVFNIVWAFIMVGKIADSIKAELNMRGTPTSDRPTYEIGLAHCILVVCGWIPIVGGFTGIASIVCWIIYWVKVNEYKNKFLFEPYTGNKDSQVFGDLHL